MARELIDEVITLIHCESNNNPPPKSCSIIKNYGDEPYCDVKVEDLGVLVHRKTIGSTDLGLEGIICFLNGDLNQGIVISSSVLKFDVDDFLDNTSINPVQNKVIDYALSCKADIDDVPTRVSELVNDSGFLTSHQSLAEYVKSASLENVAFSGDYYDLYNLPSIPPAYSHPSYSARTSGLYKITVDNLGHISAVASVSANDLPNISKSKITDFPSSMTPTSHVHGSIQNNGTLNSDISSVNKIVVTDTSNNVKTIANLPYSKISGTPTVPSKTSQLTNDSNFISLSDVKQLTGILWRPALKGDTGAVRMHSYSESNGEGVGKGFLLNGGFENTDLWQLTFQFRHDNIRYTGINFIASVSSSYNSSSRLQSWEGSWPNGSAYASYSAGTVGWFDVCVTKIDSTHVRLQSNVLNRDTTVEVSWLSSATMLTCGAHHNTSPSYGPCRIRNVKAVRL